MSLIYLTEQFTAFVTQTEVLFLIDDKIVTHFHAENKSNPRF